MSKILFAPVIESIALLKLFKGIQSQRLAIKLDVSYCYSNGWDILTATAVTTVATTTTTTTTTTTMTIKLLTDWQREL